MTLLEVDNVSKLYGSHYALRGVSLSVHESCVHGLVGANGAGKTTLIRLINRVAKPDGGEVRLLGESLSAAHAALIGYLPEERGLYHKMRVGEQAVYFARLRGMSRADAEQSLRHLFDHLGISPWWNRTAAELSKGMQQMVQYAVAIAHRPRLLVLDEPFSGFDVLSATTLQAEIRRLAGEGTAVLLSSHNLQAVQKLCHTITVLSHGTVAASGTATELCTEGRTLQQIVLQTSQQ